MSHLVLDCSVTMSWFISDESNINHFHILELIGEKGAIVPSIWPLEVGNTLLVAERRKRITSTQRHNAIRALNELSIKIDDPTCKRALKETIKLAESCNLSLYDASYLELASRLSLPIATFDKQLILAAKELGIVSI